MDFDLCQYNIRHSSIYKAFGFIKINAGSLKEERPKTA